jgi:hypothetical protein
LNMLEAISALAFDGRSPVALYGPILLWVAGLASALAFASRRKRILRFGGWTAATLLVVLAGLHAHNVRLAQAQAEALWGAYLSDNTPRPAVRVGQPNETSVLLLNSHLLPGVMEAIADAYTGGTNGEPEITQPRVDKGVWPTAFSHDVFDRRFPANTTAVVILNAKDDPQGAPNTPASADVIRVFLTRTDGQGVVRMDAARDWQGHYAVFQTPRFPFPLDATQAWEPVGAEVVVDELMAALATRTAR